MAKFMRVSMTYRANTHNFHARQDEHNHTKSNEFSKAAKDLMVTMYPGSTAGDIRQGPYESNQNNAKSPSNELVWRSNKWVQGRA
jgi:hypothetical protein